MLNGLSADVARVRTLGQAVDFALGFFDLAATGFDWGQRSAGLD